MALLSPPPPSPHPALCPSGNPHCSSLLRRRPSLGNSLLSSSSADGTSSFSHSLSASIHPHHPFPHHHPFPSQMSSSSVSCSVSPFVRLPPFSAFYADQPPPISGQHSRGESSLELEALTAVHQFAIAVQSIAVSEMLPRTPDLIFVNLTTLEGQPFCLELTSKGWRVTSLRSDCMQGDFTRMELFTPYYRTLYELMDVISPEYRERFAERLSKRCHELGGNGNRRMIWRTSTDAVDYGYPACSDCWMNEERRGSNSSSTSSSSCSPCGRRIRSPPSADNGTGRHSDCGGEHARRCCPLHCPFGTGSRRASSLLLQAPCPPDMAGSSGSSSRCSPSPPLRNKDQKQPASP